MKSYGLTNVKLEAWEVPIGWTRGTATAKLVEPREMALTVASAGWAPGTPDGAPRTLKVVSFDARSRKDLEQYRGTLKDAIVLRGKPTKVAPVTDTRYGGGVNRPSRDTPPPKDGADGKPQPPSEEEAKEFKALQEELSAFFKAEGVAAVFRDSGKPHGLLVTTGGFKEKDDRVSAVAPFPTLFVAHEHYAYLYRLIAEHKLAPTVTLQVTNTFSTGPVTAYNTVGELTGSEKPDEFVILGAHLDSWDLGMGTTDNGTGSSVILETARTLGALAKLGLRPKRTIRFCLFTGEEQGLHGSTHYVKQHKSELEKTSCALVHDTGTGKVLNIQLMGRTVLEPILGPELAALKAIGFEGVATTSSGGTDHLPFEAAGVPGFPCRQDMDEYRFTHHTQSDTLDKAKPENLVQGAQVLAVAAYRIADLPALLPREKPAKKEKDAKP
jgi:carboxypeptidase Q